VQNDDFFLNAATIVSPMDFWTRIKDQIKGKNTTWEWIAGKIGVPFGAFRKWLTQKTYPDIKLVISWL
jgi:superoxide dismutase